MTLEHDQTYLPPAPLDDQRPAPAGVRGTGGASSSSSSGQGMKREREGPHLEGETRGRAVAHRGGQKREGEDIEEEPPAKWQEIESLEAYGKQDFIKKAV